MPRLTHLSILLILLSAFIGWNHSAAQSEWSAWVYDPDEARLLRLDREASVQTVRHLPLEDGWTLARDITISPDGNFAALLLHAEDQPSQKITLLNLLTDEVSAESWLSLPQRGTLNADDLLLFHDNAFSVDGNRFAFLERHGGEGWQLHLYDVANQQTISTLSSRDARIQVYASLHAGAEPIVRAIYEDIVIFTVLPLYGTLPHSYVWNVESSELSETIAAPTLFAAPSLNGEELVSSLADWRFAAEIERIPYHGMQINTLQIYAAGERMPFFTVPDLHLGQVWFVQDGERLLVEAVG